MDFKNAFEHYKNGAASEEERRFVEEEIEKYQLIAEHLDTGWESPPEAELPQADLKRVRKNLRKRNTLIVLTSLVLAAALLLGCVYVAIPAAEKFYWDPNENTYDIQYYTDLDFSLAAYAELFCPGLSLGITSSTRTGFATYELLIPYWDAAQGGNDGYANGTLERGKLTLPRELLSTAPVNIFEKACYPVYTMDDEFKQDTVETLSSLPDYIQVEAAVSFPEDMSMEQLLEFKDQLKDGHIVWVGIRNCPEDEQRFPLCGIAPFTGGYVKEELNEYYPNFDVHLSDVTAENLESHFKTLLQYAKDQMEKGRSLSEEYFADVYYCEKVLSYVEDNGIYTYGAYIVGPSQMFLDLLDSGVASQVWIQDAWIDA